MTLQFWKGQDSITATFRHRILTPSRNLLLRRYWGLIFGVKRMGNEGNESLPRSDRIVTACRFNLAPPLPLHSVRRLNNNKLLSVEHTYIYCTYIVHGVFD